MLCIRAGIASYMNQS